MKRNDAENERSTKDGRQKKTPVCCIPSDEKQDLFSFSKKNTEKLEYVQLVAMARKHLFQGSPKKAPELGLYSPTIYGDAAVLGDLPENPGIRVCIASYGEQAFLKRHKNSGSQERRGISFRKGNKESTKSECGLCHMAMEKGKIFFSLEQVGLFLFVY